MKIRSLQNKKNQSGYTMLELLLVLGIIISLTAIMLYAFLSRANKQSAIETAVAQVGNIVAAERAAVQQQKEIIPFKDKDGAGKLVTFGLQQQIAQNPEKANPWGGNYVVGPAEEPGQFQVSMGNIPSSIIKGDYDNFVKLLSRLGEGTGSTVAECTSTGSTIACSFDNQ